MGETDKISVWGGLISIAVILPAKLRWPPLLTRNVTGVGFFYCLLSFFLFSVDRLSNESLGKFRSKMCMTLSFLIQRNPET